MGWSHVIRSHVKPIDLDLKDSVDLIEKLCRCLHVCALTEGGGLGEKRLKRTLLCRSVGCWSDEKILKLHQVPACKAIREARGLSYHCLCVLEDFLSSVNWNSFPFDWAWTFWERVIVMLEYWPGWKILLLLVVEYRVTRSSRILRDAIIERLAWDRMDASRIQQPIIVCETWDASICKFPCKCSLFPKSMPMQMLPLPKVEAVSWQSCNIISFITFQATTHSSPFLFKLLLLFLRLLEPRFDKAPKLLSGKEWWNAAYTDHAHPTLLAALQLTTQSHTAQSSWHNRNTLNRSIFRIHDDIRHPFPVLKPILAMNPIKTPLWAVLLTFSGAALPII